MRSIRVDFEELGVGVDLYPATSENVLYAEYLEDLVRPHKFALALDRFSDKAATKLLAEAFAETVVVKDDEFEKGKWLQWFVDHPIEFHQVIHIAEHPDLWAEFSNGSVCE
jgi:hypothetical protein